MDRLEKVVLHYKIKELVFNKMHQYGVVLNDSKSVDLFKLGVGSKLDTLASIIATEILEKNLNGKAR